MHACIHTVSPAQARCRNVGKEGPSSDFQFAREWVDATRNWPIFWLNDRSVPRRPWLHVEKSDDSISGNDQVNFIDSVLRDHPPAPHNTFSCRKLDVEFAVLIADEHAKEAQLHALVGDENPKLDEPLNKAKKALLVQRLLASERPLQQKQVRRVRNYCCSDGASVLFVDALDTRSNDVLTRAHRRMVEP